MERGFRVPGPQAGGGLWPEKRCWAYRRDDAHWFM